MIDGSSRRLGVGLINYGTGRCVHKCTLNAGVPIRWRE
jgi:hypothetical protein